MKQVVLFAGLILVAALTASAQITINRSDMGSMIGVRFINANDTTNLTALSPGNAGANQTWDLSGIGIDYRDTTPNFVQPAGTLCPEKFPTATYAAPVEEATVGLRACSYIHDDNSSLESLGACISIPFIMEATLINSPPQKTFTFPSTYNTSFSGQSKNTLQVPSSTPGDSTRTVSTVTYSNVIDGWGTVITPAGTYPCLRQKAVSSQLDSNYAYTGGEWGFTNAVQYDTTITYRWIGKNSILFGANITMTTNGIITNASYTISSLAVGVEETPAKKELAVFPSPADATLQWNTPDGIIAITDVLGRKVLEMPALPQSADISGLAPGVYVLTIRTATDPVSRTFVKK